MPRHQSIYGSVPELYSSEISTTTDNCKLDQENTLSHLTPANFTSESKSAPTSVRNSLILEEEEEEQDESDADESMSITTGRLSLSLGTDSINVKSEVIQTEQVDAVEHNQQRVEECTSDQFGEMETTSIVPVEEAAVEEGKGQNPGN